jgi:hypothetical protein
MVKWSFASAGCVLFLTGCVTNAPVERAALPAIEHYADGEIIVGTSASGKLVPREGCLLFIQQAGALAAQFPAGTTYSPRGDVQLPAGETLPLNTRLNLVFEARPGVTGRAAGCARLQAMQIIRRKN